MQLTQTQNSPRQGTHPDGELTQTGAGVGTTVPTYPRHCDVSVTDGQTLHLLHKLVCGRLRAERHKRYTETRRGDRVSNGELLLVT